MAPSPRGFALQEAIFGGRVYRKDGALAVSGASIALTAAIYREVGGLEPRNALEDEQLEDALRRHGVPIERLALLR